LLAGTCPVEMFIPVQFKEDTVSNARACDLDVVEELKVKERNLFAIFPIGATMQDDGKRKEVMSCACNIMLNSNSKSKIEIKNKSKIK